MALSAQIRNPNSETRRKSEIRKPIPPAHPLTQRRRESQRFAEKFFFSAFLRVPLRLCVKPGSRIRNPASEVARRLHGPSVVRVFLSLTPNFSWVYHAPAAVQPFQRFPLTFAHNENCWRACVLSSTKRLPMNVRSPESCRQFPLSPSEGERAGVRGPFLRWVHDPTVRQKGRGGSRGPNHPRGVL